MNVMSERRTTTAELTRRQICKTGALALAGLALPSTLQAATLISEPTHTLSFYHTHTNETLHGATYRKNGSLQPDTLHAIYHILRDHRCDQMAAIDLNLLDQLTRLNRQLGNQEPLHIISGFRSAETNAYLRKKSQGGGVAKRSLHMDGRAIDIRIPGFDVYDIYTAAVSLKAGGVGLYPGLKFIHIDTGEIKYWNG
jgi:uncharacterized protein YcbK (DUF882 family)